MHAFLAAFLPILITSVLPLLGPLPARADASEDVEALNSQAVQLYIQRRYAEALNLASRALSLAEETLGPEHPSTLGIINRLGGLYRMQGRYAEAEPLYRRALGSREKVLGPEHLDTLSSVNNLAALYQLQGRYGEAEPLFQRARAGYERALGPEHPDTLTSVNNLGSLYQALGRYGEAEPLFQRARAGYERTLGPEHPNTLMSVNNLGGLSQLQGRYAEAEALFQHALTRSEKALGPEHYCTLLSINNLATLYQLQGRYAEAESFYKRALTRGEKALGPEHPDTLMNVNNLASLYQAQGRYGEAEPLFQRTLASREKTLGPEHPATFLSVNNLASLYQEQGRHAEAGLLYRRALAGYERALGPEHPDTLSCVSNLASLYRLQGRHSEAESLYKRVLASREKALGQEHPDTLMSINNLAALYQLQDRHPEAEPLYRRALASREKALGHEHPDTLVSVNNLGSLYRAQGRFGEAEPLYSRALAGRERALGAEHPDTLMSVNNLGGLYHAQGRYGEAEPLYSRALAGRERALGAEHPDTLSSIHNLASLHFAQRDWSRAAALWRRSTAGIAARTQRGVEASDQTPAGKQKSEAQQQALQFRGLVRAVYRLLPDGGAPDRSAPSQMFETAQWALGSEAAQALAQMAARSASGNPALAAAVRDRQDLVGQWQRRELLQSIALGQEPPKRNALAEAENNSHMTAIGKRIAEIDTELAARFPDYAVLASPAPLSVEAAQAQLSVDEALLLFLDTPQSGPAPEETFIWAVTRTDMRWVRSDLGRAALTREVQALRCGLDYTAWKVPRCKELTGAQYTLADYSAGKPLPFDHARAHRLYMALLGQVEDLIRGKHLLLVPSGALTQLPFQVLVTAPPAAGDHRSVSWLARGHALTVLPAVSSLKALRATGRPSAAPKPMIGFGNPLLDGDPADDFHRRRATLARDSQRCYTRFQRIAAAFGWRGALPVATRDGLARLSDIRRQLPLPETAKELCDVARDVGVDPGEIRLGAQATESAVKAMSKDGTLAQYRMIHFATHGLMAGQLSGSAEPGLILTPPDAASETDDGYLSAAEIASLKLDADWVILSACNTAAGDTTSAEALSGLARAFIYAQARSLLVSHWEVDSDATVKLITATLREIARDTTVGRAEALRRAMQALIDKGEAQEAHPAIWAPFVVVGEGAR